MKYFLIYLAIINVLAFLLYAIDKWKAIHNKWRIKEATLLGIAFIGGTIGGLIAMQTFRHKTQKAPFKIGVPVMLVIHIVAVVYLKVSGVF